MIVVTCLNSISHDLPKILILLRAWNTPRSITLARPTTLWSWPVAALSKQEPAAVVFLLSAKQSGQEWSPRSCAASAVGISWTLLFPAIQFFCVKSWIYCRLILMGTGFFMPDLTRIMVSRGAVSFQMKTSSVGDSELTMLNGCLQREYICRDVW